LTLTGRSGTLTRTDLDIGVNSPTDDAQIWRGIWSQATSPA